MNALNPASWSPFATIRDTSTFLQLVTDELRVRDLNFTGAPPALLSPSGKTLLLDNIALRCSTESRAHWPAIVGEFLDAIGRLDVIDDPTAMSPDVARSSLRLRLAPADVPGERFGVAPDTTTAPGRVHDHDIVDLAACVLRRDAMPGAVWLLYLQIVGGAFGVTSDHLAGWGIDHQEAFELARTRTCDLPVPRLRWIGGARSVCGASMFTHTRVLDPSALVPNSPEGWFVAVPSREEVLAVRAVGTSDGLRSLVELVASTDSRIRRSGYPLFGMPWFVPPAGIGPYGECAERIDLHIDPASGRFLGVRFGPLVHELFDEA